MLHVWLLMASIALSVMLFVSFSNWTLVSVARTSVKLLLVLGLFVCLFFLVDNFHIPTSKFLLIYYSGDAKIGPIVIWQSYQTLFVSRQKSCLGVYYRNKRLAASGCMADYCIKRCEAAVPIARRCDACINQRWRASVSDNSSDPEYRTERASRVPALCCASTNDDSLSLWRSAFAYEFVANVVDA